eukprot:PhF_6_TR22537/c0_g2_i10/m.32022
MGHLTSTAVEPLPHVLRLEFGNKPRQMLSLETVHGGCEVFREALLVSACHHLEAIGALSRRRANHVSFVLIACGVPCCGGVVESMTVVAGRMRLCSIMRASSVRRASRVACTAGSLDCRSWHRVDVELSYHRRMMLVRFQPSR